jgi:anti-sigma factor RsiW
MSGCPDRYENILLDIYGELDSSQRSSLVQHLASCQGCREERQKVLQLVERIRGGFQAMVLSEDKAKALSSSIRRKLLEEKAPRPFWKRFLSPRRIVPALAAACIVVVSVGWFGLRMVSHSPSQDLKNARNAVQERQINPNDIEVISNLDLLEELDVLKILVHVVDGKETL